MENEFKRGELSGITQCIHRIKTILKKSLQEELQVNANVLMLAMLEDIVQLSSEIEKEMEE